MNSKMVWTTLGAMAIGLVFFGVVMFASMSLVMLNANTSPEIVWFPLPVTAILAGAILWAQRRWDIGLKRPMGRDFVRELRSGILCDTRDQRLTIGAGQSNLSPDGLVGTVN